MGFDLEAVLREKLAKNGLPVDEHGDDWVIVAIDYSQIELRVAANIFREPLWIESFLKGHDIHTTNARLAYRDQSITKSDPRRKQGKTMNFATLYGAQADTVAQHGNIPVKLAESMLANFFGAAQKLREGIESLKRQGKADKYVKTWFGRKRPLDEYFSGDPPRWLMLKGEREAVNSPIQGGAADIFKIACYKVWKLLHEKSWDTDWLPILYVHDEMVSRVRRSRVYEMLPVVVQTMEFPVKGWPVPIKADAEIGWDWGHLRAADEWMALFPPTTATDRLVSWLDRSIAAEAVDPLYNSMDFDADESGLDATA